MTFNFFLFYPYVSKAKSHEIWGPYRVSEKFGERVTGGVGKFTYPPPLIGLRLYLFLDLMDEVLMQ